ncbi:MAG: response regulator [Blastocatellia bacterium]|nr:response regulator [Blastocatellia bacterium]
MGTPAWCQNQPIQSYKFEYLNQTHGLSNNAIRAMYQDQLGFLWIGTEDGLNRYDGVSVRTYRHDPAQAGTISANTVVSLFEDRKGTLWAGTSNHGLNRYNRATDTFSQIPLPFPTAEFSHQSVFAITEDSLGNLWLGGQTGLLKLDADRQTFSFFPLPAASQGNAITCLTFDGASTLWMGSGPALYFLKPGQPQITLFTPAEAASHADFLFITRVVFHPSGKLFVADFYRGLTEIDTRLQRVTTVYHHNPTNAAGSLGGNQVLDLKLVAGHFLWIAIGSFGLDRLDLDSGNLIHLPFDPSQPNGLAGAYPTVLWVDRSETLWIGDTSYGISRLSPFLNRFRLFQHDPHQVTSLSNNFIRAMSEDAAGQVWITTQFGGFNRLDRQTGHITRFELQLAGRTLLKTAESSAVLVDRQGTIWVGGTYGLGTLNPQMGLITLYPLEEQKPITALCEDTSGNLWFSYGAGIGQISPDRKRFQAFTDAVGNPATPPADQVQALFQDRFGFLWIGGEGIAIQFDLKSSQFVRYDHRTFGAANPKGIYVCHFFEDHAGKLWVATKGAGVHRFEREQQTFTHITTKQGLPSDLAYAVVEDRALNLWLSTDAGIVRYTPATNQFRTFGLSDGLQGLEFNRRAVLQCRDGEIFFGGPNGLNSFYPETIRDNATTPPIFLTGFKTLERSYPIFSQTGNQTEVVLPYQETSFTISFAALDFTAPRHNRYACRLLDFHSNWINQGNQTEVTYANLDPGQYQFEVKGANHDGYWSQQPAILTIRILPPPWRTWWAYGLYLVGLAGLVYGGFAVQAARLKEQTLLQQARFAAELAHRESEVARIKAEAAEQENRQRAASENEIRVKNAELEQANLKLRELDELKAKFTAMLVHDLKSPLTVVSTALELLYQERSQKNDALTDLLKVSERNIEKIVRMVNEMLDVYRTENQETSLDRKIMDLPSLLQEVVASTQVAAAANGIRLTCQVEAGLPAIFGDSAKLERVFSNLLSNAIKFTPVGGAIGVHAWTKAGEGIEAGQSFVLVSVNDNGAGIPAESIPFLFDPYWQADSQKKKAGVGLGLSIVKRIVAAHGGNVSVRSRVGVGTSFTVVLPAPGAPLASKPVRPSAVQDQSTESIPTGLSVLIAEDNVVNQKILRGQFTKLGFRVTMVSNGREAVEAARQNEYHLIVMDCQMPVMDGTEAASLIRQDENNQHPPILAITASHIEELKRQPHHFDQVLEKPYRFEDLQRILERVFKQVDSQR